MTKRPHPADLAADAAMVTAIRSADHFMASLFRGVGEYEKRTAPTVKAALDQAAMMEAQSKRTMQALIYAIGRDGRATMITRSLIDRLRALPRA